MQPSAKGHDFFFVQLKFLSTPFIPIKKILIYVNRLNDLEYKVFVQTEGNLTFSHPYCFLFVILLCQVNFTDWDNHHNMSAEVCNLKK